MANSYVDDVFQDVYKQELEHKDRLDSADGLLVGVLIVLSGVGLYYLKLLPSCSWSFAGCLFIIFGIFFFLCYVFATVSIIQSTWPRDKAYLSSPNQLDEYVRGLEAHFNHCYDRPEADQLVEEDLRAALRQQFTDAGQINRTSNIRKNGWQTRAKYSIAAAVLMIVVNACPTCVVQHAHSEPQKVEVIKLPKMENIKVKVPKLENARNGKRRDQPVKTGTAKTASPKEARPTQDRGSPGG